MAGLRALALCLAALLGAAGARTPQEWQARTIYQIVTDRFALPPSRAAAGTQDGARGRGRGQPPTPQCALDEVYCGGTFKGIESKLDYIAGMGFDAIWISPVVANVGQNYHGYAASNIYQVNPSFGGAADLQSLIAACHARDIWVMVDVVANHMGIPNNYDFSQLTPFNTSAFFHSCASCPSNCWISDWDDQQQIETCRLDGLPDLNQSRPDVNATLVNWVRQLVSNFSIDGLRVDTVQEVAMEFWAGFQQAAGVYAVGEVFNGDAWVVAPYQGSLDGLLSYPIYFTALACFAQQQSLYNLQNQIQEDASAFSDVGLLGTFIDNHDNPRFLNLTSDYALYRNALTFTLLSSGIPIVYYGTEAGYSGGDTPDNRLPLWLSGFATDTPLYQFLAQLVAYRKAAQVWQYEQVQRYADDSFYAFTRGLGTFVALTNVGSGGGDVTRTITYQQWPDGTKLCNLFDASDCVLVQNQQFQVTLTGGEPKVYSPAQ
jgi:alpha-amylase